MPSTFDCGLNIQQENGFWVQKLGARQELELEGERAHNRWIDGKKSDDGPNEVFQKTFFNIPSFGMGYSSKDCPRFVVSEI